MHLRPTLAVIAAGAISYGGLGLPLPSAAAQQAPHHPTAQHGTSSQAHGPASVFSRLATYPVFQNVPDGVDPADPTVAEISAASPDGKTVAYTDAAGGRIGFLDISDPGDPKGLGTFDVSGGKGGSPTSVSIVPSSAGDVALVVVDDSTYPDDGSGSGTRAGRLDVVTLASPHTEVASIDLGGQPDSIAISPDGKYAAIAMENQRNELACKDGATITVDPDDVEDSDCSDGDLGDLPQAPSGFVQVIDLASADPADWTASPVTLDADTLAGLDTPEDAEPEYVDINDRDQLALTLQENNGVVVIDLRSKKIQHVWSAGNDVVPGIDTTDDGLFDPDDTIDLPREPDAIQWVGNGLVATANEGDWKGGTRGWTVFDAATGKVVWDAGNSYEKLAVKYGLFNNDRADNKGTEPEGLAYDVIGGTPYAFVGSERSNFVAVYDMTNPRKPAFEQVLPATNGPEGLLPIPKRNLFVVSSEEDDADALVRASVSVYRLGTSAASFPTIESATGKDGFPIGWGALGALSAVPGRPHELYAASDVAYATGRIYTVETSRTPARITDVLEVKDADGAVIDDGSIDIEGIFARPQGGFWAADEGATGAENALLRLSSTGRILQSVPLPAEISSHIKSWGLEGVTAVGSGRNEQVYVAAQRPLWVDPTVSNSQLQELEGHVARIGRYTPATGQWEWFGYPLESTSVSGDWLGLSEITAVDTDTLAVIERDKQNGTTARIKRVYTVDVPKHGVTGSDPITAPLTKHLAYDVLPALRAPHGWTQEKLEGLTIGADKKVYAVTDNDGLSDATGETVFLRLGPAGRIFGR
ncbi:esterase-like activity of phytase family protein [Nocardioides cheoyonin]|uniref:esterase-like activity of phytase family protein n=1 Tax=Nocardioides cheoyonin TaxID=3156615 RepID=UPI0032B4512E